MDNGEGRVIDLTCGGEPHGAKRSRSKLIHTSFPHPQRDASSASSTSSFDSLEQTENSRSAMPHNPRRFVGDGLDMRRPAALTPAVPDSNFVDLTTSDDEDNGNGSSASSFHPTEQHAQPAYQIQPELRRPNRQPRFDREIIHLDDSSPPSERPVETARRTPQPNASLVNEQNSRTLNTVPPNNYFSRRLPPLPSNNPLPRGDLRSAGRAIPPAAEVIDITDDGDDEIIIEFSRPRIPGRSHFEIHRPGNSSRAGALLSRLRSYVGPNLAQPLFDYTTQAFLLGRQHEEIPAPAPPQYAELPPCPPGFTRSPREGDVLICPSCQDELCTIDGDEDKEKKGELWVVKACGHVYCGYCATGRPKKNPSRKTLPKQKKTSTEPFTMCRAPGCQEKVVGAKAMIQVFL